MRPKSELIRRKTGYKRSIYSSRVEKQAPPPSFEILHFGFNLTLSRGSTFSPYQSDQSRSQQLLDLKSQALENSTTPTKESESSTSTSHDGGEAPAPVLAPATIEGKGVCDQLISVSGTGAEKEARKSAFWF